MRQNTANDVSSDAPHGPPAGHVAVLSAGVLVVVWVCGCVGSVGSWIAGPRGSADRYNSNRDVYDAKCLACHRPHLPSEYSASRWRQTINKHKKRLRLNPAEREAILRYVTGASEPHAVRSVETAVSPAVDNVRASASTRCR